MTKERQVRIHREEARIALHIDPRARHACVELADRRAFEILPQPVRDQRAIGSFCRVTRTGTSGDRTAQVSDRDRFARAQLVKERADVARWFGDLRRV